MPEHDQPVVRLINDISAQFGHRPVAQAAAAVAAHIETFWDPRMRAQLAGLGREARGRLDERARAAVSLLRAAEPGVG
jgi:formate dehydrogenase subunit delta